ncbi:type I-E CRISPR-associated protein Cse2/CasB [Nocardia terpenica]|uniref:type I-E CRISPR-associated protein Cse2/CasB n=1 Tax=Nocardia terpenica TaxID=455432 RepID=UPI00189525FA|nr:type I-E CRISPR-associated protein Cse2/CasB [Nocardia terpenica]MBF6063510.1 type I-E CRISPR-associated protein Cse2/CasB [Nocardia terpenica]MBF6106066.1 type I-E CRISPR-associated protein Cse2/CasB [Nocardia terpenica]MBF6113349.1 type I-E CRISPR-associated protein Cse2/CasB [Nocardia terpenica]MBF6119807.1 type I-E CRISPR-associated protein Cse2/CasB [Nocardia terpenica]MBF6152218.1 type I-E CRISPR-associated protein Cse2/CasB [Nocardia terpenica]
MSERQESLQVHAQAMVSGVAQVVNSSTGARAALRRALRRPPDSDQARNAHRIVAPYLPGGADTATERAFYAVASMIAAQPRTATDSEQDIGAVEETVEAHVAESDGGDRAVGDTSESLGKMLGRATALGAVKFDSMEKHLHLLCRQQLHGVHQHLPRLILRLRRERVDISWARLIVDLATWPYGRDRITKRWLQDFYRTHHAITAARKQNSGNNSDSSESEDL